VARSALLREREEVAEEQPGGIQDGQANPVTLPNLGHHGGPSFRKELATRGTVGTVVNNPANTRLQDNLHKDNNPLAPDGARGIQTAVG